MKDDTTIVLDLEKFLPPINYQANHYWRDYGDEFLDSTIDHRLMQAKNKFPDYTDADALVADAFMRGL
jgi:hypothetical protein